MRIVFFLFFFVSVYAENNNFPFNENVLPKNTAIENRNLKIKQKLSISKIDTIYISFGKKEIFEFKKDVNYNFNVLTRFADSLLKIIPKDKKYTISVVPFKSSTFENAEGRVLAEGVIFNTRSNPNVDVVNYRSFKKAVREVSLRDSKLELISLKIGNKLQTDYVVCGNIVDVFGEKIVTGVLRDRKTGKVLNVVKVVVEAQELNRVTNFVLQERSSIAPYFLRSLILPGWGQIYGNRKVRGSIFMGLSIASYSLSAYSWYQVSNSSSKDYDKNLNFAKNVSLVSLGILGLNLIDATIIGYRDMRKYELYFVQNRDEFKFKVAYNW